nr:MAG TPA: hypothetical protein [Caudoviricetes sp.]
MECAIIIVSLWIRTSLFYNLLLSFSFTLTI